MVTSPQTAFSPYAAMPFATPGPMPGGMAPMAMSAPQDVFTPGLSVNPAGYKRLGEILTEAGLVHPQVIQNALMQSRMTGERLGQVLVRQGQISPDQLNGALGYQQQLVQQLQQAQVNIPQPSNGQVNFTPVPGPPAIPANPMLDRMIIHQALQRLLRIQNLPADEAYVRHMGITPPFQNGAQAMQLILDKNIRVEFGDMGDSAAHAQWIADQNLIMINQRYRGDTSPATIYAVAEAIYHEAGHASGNGDNESSIQEELNCLSLNTLAHRFHEVIDPAYAQANSSSRLISDGVALYAKLFFDPDPNKQALVNRVVQKYGDLPMWSPGHNVPPPVSPKPMAYRVAEQVDANNVARGVMPPSYALNGAAGFSQPALPQPQAYAPRLNMVA